MKYSIMLVLLFSANVASSQKFIGVENAASKNTLKKLAGCLIPDGPTTEDRPGNVTVFYKEIVRNFFDTAKMEKRFRQIEKDNGISYNQIKNGQYSTLSKMADMFNYEGSNSFVMGWNEFKRRNQIEGTKYNKNTLIIGFIIDDSWNDRYFIEFDDTGKKIILLGSIAMMIDMDKELLKWKKNIINRYSSAGKKNKKKPAKKKAAKKV
jgi:hypothetical protein